MTDIRLYRERVGKLVCPWCGADVFQTFDGEDDVWFCGGCGQRLYPETLVDAGEPLCVLKEVPA